MENVHTYICNVCTVIAHSMEVCTFYVCMYVQGLCIWYVLYTLIHKYMHTILYLQYVQCVPFKITLQLLIILTALHCIAELKRNLQTERDHVKSLAEEKEQLVCKPTILYTVCSSDIPALQHPILVSFHMYVCVVLQCTVCILHTHIQYIIVHELFT